MHYRASPVKALLRRHLTLVQQAARLLNQIWSNTRVLKPLKRRAGSQRAAREPSSIQQHPLRGHHAESSGAKLFRIACFLLA